MDLADKAEAAEAVDRSAALSRRKPELMRIGLCYNCGESIALGVLHDYCIADYEREQKMRAINGER